MLLVIDGPEKAGKTSLIAALAERVHLNRQETRIRKWGKLDDGKWAIDEVYGFALDEDLQATGLVIWDRSWASETVYGQLLGRDRRLAAEPDLGDQLYGRRVQLKFILGGPSPAIMLGDRTEDDLPVAPAQEQEAFVAYGRRYGWHIIGLTDRDRLPMYTLVTAVRLQVEGVLRGEERQS